jgi:multidrug resistance efflux pump
MNAYGCLLAAVLLAGQNGLTPDGPGTQANSSSYDSFDRCLVSLIDRVELPAEEAGVLTRLEVQEGMLIQTGQVLGTVDDSETLIKKKAAEYRLAVAQEKATNDAQLQVARKLIELAEAEYNESVQINIDVPGSVPSQRIRRQKVQWEKAELDYVAAQMEFKIAGLERDVAQAEVEAIENELDQRNLKAPFNGVIVQKLKHEREWVQPGDPVLAVIRMDRLRVETFLNTDTYAPEEVGGTRVEVIADLKGAQEAVFEGKIDHVSSTVEANGDYRVWAEVDNRPTKAGDRWLLLPGAEAEMRIYGLNAAQGDR